MATVFLSYDRDDEAKARSFATALEASGHSVWWDQHIRAGHQFSKEIDKALMEADVVVVLWSRHSVESAWVRDEAAAGRDSGRLVPVRLDSCAPPLGFRQYQTIDLSKAGGRRRSKAMSELLGAIAAIDGGGQNSPPVDPQRVGARIGVRGAWPVVLALIAILAIAGAIIIWRPWSSGHTTPSVMVAAADDSEHAKALASNLLVQLGSLQAAGAGDLQLVEAGSSSRPDFTFKVGTIAGSGEASATLSFIDSSAGVLLWSREFRQPGGNAADLRQQIAYSAGQVLRCATEALSPDHPKLELTTLKLYLNGCADLTNLIDKGAGAAASTFKRVTEEAPEFAGGWAKLLLAQIEEMRTSDPKDYGPAQRNLRSYIAAARKLDPTMTEAYLAESWIQPPRPIIGWMQFTDEAVRRNPDHSEALEMHALGMRHVGRMQDAVADVRRAAQSNPLSPTARESLVIALMDSGALPAARNELRSAEQLWPGATGLVNLRFILEYRYGDPKVAMQMIESGVVGEIPPGAQNFLHARIDPTAANIERAITDSRKTYEESPNGGGFSTYVQVLATLGRTEDAIHELLTVDPRIAPGIVVAFFRPHMSNVRRDRHFMAIAKRFELIPYWRESGKWPDFCFEPGQPYDCKAEAAKYRPS